MKRFHFRLQSVLTLREQAEQSAQRQLAQAYAAAEAASARVRAAEAAVASHDEFRRQRLTAGAAVQELERIHAYAVVLRERLARLASELAEARRQAETARCQLVLAAQRREVLDRLRTRQRQAHAYEFLRAEQKLLDDLPRPQLTLTEPFTDSRI